MSKTILLRGARQLLTLRGRAGPRRGPEMNDLAIIPDGALLIVDGVIREVGPSRRVENLSEAAKAVELDATGKVVLPGFIDCHAHLVSGPPALSGMERPAEEAACGAGWVIPCAAAVRTHTVHRMEMEARRLLRQFIRCGTTTIEAKSGFGLDRSTELKCLRVFRQIDQRPLSIVPTYHALHVHPDDGDRQAFAAWVASEMVPLVRRRRLARFVDVSCEAGGFDCGGLRAVAEAAAAHGLGLKIHTVGERCADAVRMAVEMGAVSVDGLAGLGADGIRLLAASSAIAALLPGASFHSGRPYPPARDLLGAGAAVVLGTGFSNTLSPTCSMPMILALACRKMGMTPAEAVCAATINAAYATGEGRRAGSLEVGKEADLVMFGVSDYREIPYYFGMNLLVMAMRKGEPIFPRLEAI